MGDLSAPPSVVSACWSDLPFGHRGPIPQRAPAPARRELRRTRRPRTLTRLSRTESPRRTRLGLVGHGAPLRPPEEECCRSVSDFSDFVGWLFFRERISPRLAPKSPVAHGGVSPAPARNFRSRSLKSKVRTRKSVLARADGGPLGDSFGGVRSLVGPSFRSSRPDPSAGAGASPP